MGKYINGIVILSEYFTIDAYFNDHGAGDDVGDVMDIVSDNDGGRRDGSNVKLHLLLI